MHAAVAVLLFAVHSVQEAAPPPESGRSCSLAIDAKAVEAICRHGEYVFAIVHFGDGDIYGGEWRNTEHGKGFKLELIREAGHERFGWHRHVFGIWEDGELAEPQVEFDYDTGCFKSICGSGLELRHDGASEIRVGMLDEKGLQGPGVARNTIFEVQMLVGFFRDGELHGEGIVFDSTEGTIQHGLWEKGKLVELFAAGVHPEL